MPSYAVKYFMKANIIMVFLNLLLFQIGCVHHTEFHKLETPKSANVSGAKDLNCQSGKEYAAAYEFLDKNRDKSGLSEEEVLETSLQVSKGCDGAASRFLKAYNLLIKVGLSGRSALNTGKVLSKMSDDHSNAFLELFLHSYLEEHLNLDIQTSLEIASQLSIDFQGQPLQAYKDFARLTQFCREDSETQVDLLSCVKLMAMTVKKTEFYGKGMSEDFINFYKYLKNDSYLKMNVQQALILSHEVLVSGPEASSNFRYSYEFAISKKGFKCRGQEITQLCQTNVEY
jgi:hypothetical protein